MKYSLASNTDIPIKSAKSANAKQTTRAIVITGSITLIRSSSFINLGTTNQPATAITTKKIIFLPINKPSDTSLPLPKKLIITANKITTITSSTTAAPGIVVLSQELSRLRSFNICTEILTDVALFACH